MGVLSTVRDVLRASSESANRGDATEVPESDGAYWCHDCGERIRDVDVAEGGSADDGARSHAEDPPACPECGDEMEFQRSPDSAGCAC